jgi:3',5'-cyclic AMP phosphodiesterase CpdA
MRTIIHISDVHFGRVDHTLVDPLLEAIHSLKPDIMAVSGDLTQHGTEREFREAAAFLKRLPGQVIVVPGNHDMAFLNPWKRATQRLRIFHEFITNDPEPFYKDDELAVLGLNTARVTHLRNGRIREWQIVKLEQKMRDVRPGTIRVLVTHHPFDLPEIFAASDIVGRGAGYMKRVVNSIDLMLAGHMHISHAGPTAVRYDIGGDAAIFVQAGTALSTRVRTEENSFQVIRTSHKAIEVQQFVSQLSRFVSREPRVFRETDDGVWIASMEHRSNSSLISL